MNDNLSSLLSEKNELCARLRNINSEISTIMEKTHEPERKLLRDQQAILAKELQNLSTVLSTALKDKPLLEAMENELISREEPVPACIEQRLSTIRQYEHAMETTRSYYAELKTREQNLYKLQDDCNHTCACCKPR